MVIYEKMGGGEKDCSAHKVEGRNACPGNRLRAADLSTFGLCATTWILPVGQNDKCLGLGGELKVRGIEVPTPPPKRNMALRPERGNYF